MVSRQKKLTASSAELAPQDAPDDLVGLATLGVITRKEAEGIIRGLTDRVKSLAKSDDTMAHLKACAELRSWAVAYQGMINAAKPKDSINHQHAHIHVQADARRSAIIAKSESLGLGGLVARLGIS